MRNVLIIGDDEVVSQMTQARLERLGYNSRAVTNADAGREAFSDGSQRFDLVMVDHILFDGFGEELAADLARIHSDIPIVLYTGAGLTLEDCSSKGICAVIPKALSMEEFAKALRQVFDRK